MALTPNLISSCSTTGQIMASATHLPAKRSNGHAYPEISLDELQNKYEFVGVDEGGHVVVTLKEPEQGAGAVSAKTPTVQGQTRYRKSVNTDYNPAMSGTRGLVKMQEMRNDAVVRSTLKMAKSPILSARWFVEPASQDAADLERAEFIRKCLFEFMSIPFSQLLIEALYSLDYGMYAFEKVFDFKEWNGEQRVIWKKLAPRHPMDIIEVNYDDEGGPESIKFTTSDGFEDIEIWKLLIFTHDKEGGNMWGHSLLRSAYKHWFYKENLYKIDAIQKERHGIGIPVVVLPVGFNDKDRVEANRIGESLRVNEKAHVTLPPGWEVYFLKLEGNKIDALESAQHHAGKLYENILANFMSGQQIGTATEYLQEMFVRAQRFTAEGIRAVFNFYAIPQLIRYNWPEEELENGYPTLRVRRIGDERDWRTLSFAIRNLIGAEALWVDEDLRTWLRNELDMPAETASAAPVVKRTGGTPQAPQVGNPRQGPAASQGTGSNPEQGSDQSGGN